jgi:hypothetical protein
MIWIGDAPAHGKECNNGTIQDTRSSGTSNEVHQVIQALIHNKIDFLFCRVQEPATAFMENCFKSTYKKLSPEEDVKFIPLTMFDPQFMPVPPIKHFIFSLIRRGSSCNFTQKYR